MILEWGDRFSVRVLLKRYLQDQNSCMIGKVYFLLAIYIYEPINRSSHG
jgi:hypothetical protein